MRPDETRLGSWPRELAMAKRKQFEQTELIVKEFMLNEGPELQRDLKEYASKCQNWVSIAPATCVVDVVNQTIACARSTR